MHWQYPIRILSDLHIGHPLSRLRSAVSLAPLFDGVGTVMFNGDSVEPWLKPGRARARENLERLAARVRAAGASPFFISGNHDPDETPHTHADVLGGLVHVTHGDALFDRIVPWAMDGDYLAEARAHAMGQHPLANRNSVEAHLESTREAVRRLHSELRSRKERLGGVRFQLERLFWIPRKILKTYSAWKETPELARRYLRQFRPHARFMVIGHTHRPGASKAGRRILLNTGSFQVGLGTACVDVESHSITLRPLTRKLGEWRVGEPTSIFRTADYPLLVGEPGSEALR